MALRRHPGLMALDLAGPIWVEPPSVSRAVQSLERRGLLTRQPHPTDGRASLFYLTQAGELMAGAIDRVTRDTNDHIEAWLSIEQRQALGASLDILADRIEALWADHAAGSAGQGSPIAAATVGDPSKGLDR